MRKESSVHSLLPYLDRSARGVCLEIPLISEDPAYLDRQDFPFHIVDTSHPLFRIVHARFASDAGSRVRDVFLVLQKDVCTLPKEALRPMNNSDIATCWLRTFSNCTDPRCTNPPIVLAGQLDRTGRPVPLAPLFFCKRGLVFFHPPCPSCGSPLEECCDDDLLGQWNLPAHASSTNRYLFCPSCSLTRERGRFYACQMDGWETQGIEDWRGLVREYARLLEKGALEAGSPCCACSKRAGCRSEKDSATTDFIPFSFYPFFMMIFEAMSLNALDFLSLISDASCRDVRAGLRREALFGRLDALESTEETLAGKRCFLFKGEERHFLEILYLKLSFLEGLARIASADGEVGKYPDWRLSLDRIWVRFTGQASLLPHFWNFSLHRMDVACEVSPDPPPLLSSSGCAIHFLGLAWFYALLRNEGQSVKRVYEALRGVMEQTPERGSLPCWSDADAAFRPENIFWNPKGRSVDKRWLPLWNEALQLGHYLLRRGKNGYPGWPAEIFEEKLRALQEAIGKELFQGRSVAQPVDPVQTDETIRAILDKLRGKWRGETRLDEAQGSVPASPPCGEPVEGIETPRPQPERAPGSVIGTVPGEAATAAGERLPGGENLQEPIEADPPMPETVLLRGGEARVRPTPAAATVGNEDVCPETLILSSVKDVRTPPGEAGLGPASQVEEYVGGEPPLPETVLLQKAVRPVEQPEEEAMPATVLLGAQSKKSFRKEGKK